MKSSGFSSLRRRVELLGRPAGKQPHVRGDRGEFSREYAQKKLKECPDLLRVEPCDTDAATYASIRSTIANARWNEREKRYWDAQIPPTSTKGKTDMEVVQAIFTESEERSRKTCEALESARKRLGIHTSPAPIDAALLPGHKAEGTGP